MTNPRPAPQLHRLTVLQCGCCARTAEIILTSDTDQQVCDPCKVHWGNTSTKTARREREHRIGWSERLGIVENELVNQKIAAEHRVTKLVTAARNNEQQLRGQIENLEEPGVSRTGDFGFLRDVVLFEPCQLDFIGSHISQCRVKPDLVIP